MKKRTKRKKNPVFNGITPLEDGRFQVRVTKMVLGRRHDVKRVAANVEDALRLKAELEATIATEAEVGQTLSDYFVFWRRQKATLGNVTLSTLEKYDDQWRNIVERRLGQLYVDEVRAVDLKRFLIDLVESGYKRSYVQGIWSFVGQVLRDAVVTLELERDPTRGVKLAGGSAAEGDEKRALSVEQLGQLLATAREFFPNWYVFTTLMAGTGMRTGEARALRWENVDLEAGVVKVVEAVDRQGRVGRPKTRSSRRRIAIPHKLREMLVEHRRELEHGSPERFASGLVFPSPHFGSKVTGWFFGPTAFRNILERMCNMAGIPRITPHELRHTFVTILKELGTDQIMTKALAGHVTDSMTERYAHISDEPKRQVTESVLRLVTGGLA